VVDAAAFVLRHVRAFAPEARMACLALALNLVFSSMS